MGVQAMQGLKAGSAIAGGLAVGYVANEAIRRQHEGSSGLLAPTLMLGASLGAMPVAGKLLRGGNAASTIAGGVVAGLGAITFGESIRTFVDGHNASSARKAADAKSFQAPDTSEQQRFDVQQDIGDYYTEPAVLRSKWFPAIALGGAAAGATTIGVATLAGAGYAMVRNSPPSSRFMLAATAVGLLTAGAAVGTKVGLSMAHKAEGFDGKMQHQQQKLNQIGGPLPDDRFDQIRQHG